MPVFHTGKVDAAPSASGADGGSVTRALTPDSEEWDMDVVVVDVRPGHAAPPVVSARAWGRGVRAGRVCV
jgi:hypothetical protein